MEPSELKGILIGGHSPTKEEFSESGFLHYELQKKVLGLFDTGYTDESGFSELINAAEDTLQGIDLIKQKNDMKMFFLKNSLLSLVKSPMEKTMYGQILN